MTLLAVALFLGGLLVVAWPQRALPGVRWFVVFTAALMVWAGAYAAEFLLPGLGPKIVAAKLQYLGVTSVPAAWLAFAVDYTGAWRWRRAGAAAVLVVPVATLLLVWTNEYHGWVWADVALTTGLSFTVLDVTYGFWFWVHFAVAYGYLLTATALMVRVVFVRPPLFRRQALLLVLACLSPWAGNALYVAELGPAGLDLTVFGFAASGLLAGWAILRWRLLSIGPIARDAIVEGMTEAVVVVDREGRVVDANPAAARLLERRQDELVGWDARQVLGPFARVLEDPAAGECEVEGPHGRRVYDCRLNRLEDGRGGLRGWTLVLHDVTARAAEAEALDRARRTAEETAAAQRTFLANMNHELRTPLNGVLGMLEVLRGTDLDADQRRFVDIAHTSADELLTLVGRILDFTGLETGRTMLDAAPFAVAPALREAAVRHEAAAREKGLTFQVDIADGTPDTVVGDRARLVQVVDGLLDNAVKFTESGSVTLRAGGSLLPDDRVELVVEVADTGPGIPPERLDAVLEGFTQVDASSTRVHEGTGLGLALARRLVEAMGGALTVDSRPGEGSIFRCIIPLETA